MKASLQLNISQQLTLTPQLQQAIRLLQLSTIDLNQEIQEALESNPLLELTDSENNITIQKKNDVTASDKEEIRIDTQLTEHYASSTLPQKKADDNFNYEHVYGTSISLLDHLTWQLELTPMSETDKAIAIAIIDAINEDGFLTVSIDDIQQSLSSEETPIDIDEIEAVRHLLMRFDPIGCATKDLSESLVVQMEQLKEKDKNLVLLTKKIVKEDIQLLGQHNYKLILKKQRISEEQLTNVLSLIKKLHPRPGNQIDNGKTEYVIPDVVVQKEQGQWVIQLNGDALPKLRINNQYASLIQRANNTDDNVFLKNNLQEARWFLKSIQSRQETLLKVTSCIVEHQKDFLENGEEAMKPLVLNDVALKLEMHESTISRVTTQKYLHTPRGVYELKYFFSSHVNTDVGGECSSTAIRAVIKKLIAQEDPQKPWSDNKIAQLLGEKGIQVARRTIAKYREAMAIPPSNERKAIAQ